MASKLLFITPFLLILPLVQADGWDDFSNNLATDLAPILSLFGEQITKQYLSESIYKTDYFIFALAPIGILTAVVSTIRVCGSPSLRAFIGRAQEGGGSAEAELCSSTSRDVCELYNNGGIARVFGRPKILEIVYDPVNQDFEDGTAGIHTFRHYLSQPHGQSEWHSTDDKEKSAPSPNLSLNVGIKRKTRTIFRAVAVIGTILQAGVLIFAAVVTYYLKWEKEGSRPNSYACPLTIIGTVLLFCGVFLCAFLIGESTSERVFDRKTMESTDRSMSSTIYWVQPGGQILGDQTFDPFCYSDKKEPLQQYVTSWKERPKDSELLVWTAVGVTIVGFALQFTGLRGLHSAISVAQLGAIVLMSAARAALRMQRLEQADNYFAKFPDIVTGHELDWLAIRLGQVQCNAKVASIARYDVDDSAVRCLWQFYGASDDRVRIAKGPPSKLPNEINIASSILAYRTRLAGLSQAGKASSRTATSAEHFNIGMVEVRETARKLVSAIESAMNIIFSGGLGVKLTWRSAESILWRFDCEVNLKVSDGQHFLSRSSSQQTLPLQLTRPGQGGPWTLQDEFALEGLLGLWVWSLKFDPAVEVSDSEKQLAISQASEIRTRRIVSTERDVAKTDLKSWMGGTILKFAEDVIQIPSRPGSPNTIWQKNVDRWREASSDGILEGKIRFFGWHTTKLSRSQDPTSITVWSAPTTNSLTSLCGQEIFGSFLKSILGIVDYVGDIEVGTDARHLPLASKLASELVTIFVEKGLGSREDALLCIAPLVISPLKISRTEDSLAMARKSAGQLRQQGDWAQAERVLRGVWKTCTEGQSINATASEFSLTVKNTKRTAIALGELYRWALRGDDKTKRFGLDGIKWLSEQKSGVSLRTSDSVKSVIDRYTDVARTVKEAFTNPTSTDRAALEIGSDRTTTLSNVTLSISMTPQAKGNALCMAAKEGWAEVVLALLEMKAEPDFKDESPVRRTALSYAAQNGDIDTVKALLEGEAFPNLRDTDGRTPLSWASGSGNIFVVQLLLSNRSVDPNIESDNLETPLWWAADNGHDDVIKLLAQLEGRAGEVDAENSFGTTPLMRAVKSQRHAAVRVLLDTELVDPNAEDTDGLTVLSWAAITGDETITRWLLETPGIEPNAKYEEGQTALEEATKNGYEKVAKLLLEVGKAKPDSRFLLQAAEQGHQEIVRLLIDTAEVDPNVRDDNGQTPLSLAAQNGHEGIVELLLGEGTADPNIQDHSGQTPLRLALEQGYEAIVKLLDSTTI
ncbi:hypothetical protein ACHAPJ_009055 [Fusarium lateritium]